MFGKSMDVGALVVREHDPIKRYLIVVKATRILNLVERATIAGMEDAGIDEFGISPMGYLAAAEEAYNGSGDGFAAFISKYGFANNQQERDRLREEFERLKQAIDIN